MFYVYFDNETRQVVSVNNTINENLTNYVIKQKDDVEGFFTGEKNFNDYMLDKDFNIVKIEQSGNKFNFNDKLHKIEYNENPNLVVEHSNKWKFKNIKNVSGNLYFAVTEKNNPNKLIRTIFFPASSLDYEQEFKYNTEEDIDNISIWILHKSFPVCSLEVK